MTGLSSPKLLLAAIAGTGVLLGGVLVWARARQRRATVAAADRAPRGSGGSTRIVAGRPSPRQ